ncbi:hypothetical protein, partial [Enterococcus rivorum]|uniref:hypothetical protein n=1 Tax=Enterococcus rivorum TaxID=762845 RepID=UPI001B80C453
LFLTRFARRIVALLLLGGPMSFISTSALLPRIVALLFLSGPMSAISTSALLPRIVALLFLAGPMSAFPNSLRSKDSGTPFSWWSDVHYF